jgi:hypothetical protein
MKHLNQTVRSRAPFDKGSPNGYSRWRLHGQALARERPKIAHRAGACLFRRHCWNAGYQQQACRERNRRENESVGLLAALRTCLRQFVAPFILVIGSIGHVRAVDRGAARRMGALLLPPTRGPNAHSTSARVLLSQGLGMSLAQPPRQAPQPLCDPGTGPTELPAVDLTERIARFEATASRLESSRRAFVRRRPLYIKGFLALTLSGFACFAFGGLVGVWGSLSATVVSLAGFGMVRARTSELETEILALRQEIDRMRGPRAAAS